MRNFSNYLRDKKRFRFLIYTIVISHLFSFDLFKTSLVYAFDKEENPERVIVPSEKNPREDIVPMSSGHTVQETAPAKEGEGRFCRKGKAWLCVLGVLAGIGLLIWGISKLRGSRRGVRLAASGGTPSKNSGKSSHKNTHHGSGNTGVIVPKPPVSIKCPNNNCGTPVGPPTVAQPPSTSSTTESFQ